MLNKKSLAAFVIIAFIVPNPALATRTRFQCSYTDTTTWSGDCNVDFQNGRTVIYTGNGHAVNINHPEVSPYGYTSHGVTIDGKPGYMNNDGCSVTYCKKDGTLTLSIYAGEYC